MSSIGLVIGITIGGGIFRTPASFATRVPDPMWMLGVWVLGGLIVLCGALAFAELSASMPETGGMYVYLREGWGRRRQPRPAQQQINQASGAARTRRWPTERGAHSSKGGGVGGEVHGLQPILSRSMPTILLKIQ